MQTKNNSPLEYLAAFAIVFAAGVLSTAGLGAYIRKLKQQKELAFTSQK